MKIGLISPYVLIAGGVQEHIFHLAKNLKKLGHEVRIIAPGFPSGVSQPLPKGIIFIGRGRKVNVNGTNSPITLGLDYGPRIREVLAQENFDILHFHQPDAPTLSWFLLAESQTTNVATFHRTGKYSPEERALYLLFSPAGFSLTRKMHAKIAVSQTAKKQASQYFGGPFEIIPNGVDLTRFTPKGPRIKKYENGKINILFLGRLEERKGLLYLLKAFKNLQARHQNLRLLVVGEGPQKAGYEEFVQSQKIPDVFFEGHVPSPKLPTYYRTAQIFCSPATHGESFGIVLLEAMASGLPICAFANPGYRELLRGYPPSFLVPPKNITRLTQALEKLVKEPELRKKLTEWGLNHIQKYSWEKVTEEILTVYQRAKAKKTNSLFSLPDDFWLKQELSQVFTQIRRFASLLE